MQMVKPTGAPHSTGWRQKGALRYAERGGATAAAGQVDSTPRGSCLPSTGQRSKDGHPLQPR